MVTTMAVYAALVVGGILLRRIREITPPTSAMLSHENMGLLTRTSRCVADAPCAASGRFNGSESIGGDRVATLGVEGRNKFADRVATLGVEGRIAYGEQL